MELEKQEKKTIFVVDDSITTLTTGKNVLKEIYNVFTIPAGDKLFKTLEETIPDLILLDVEMPVMDGFEVIKRLKMKEETADIPVIFLTAHGDGESELMGLSLGAVDYIAKPFSPPLLQKRIDVHLLVKQQKERLKKYNESLQDIVSAKTRAVTDMQNSILRTVAELVECRDDTTGRHIERTRDYLNVLVDALLESSVYRDEIKSWDIELFLSSAQLHDVGKIKISDTILNKPGKLTTEEFDEMKTHASFGASVIERIQLSSGGDTFLDNAKIFAATHHEKWDGSGYPYGLQGEEIPLQGRLMAIADVYDALVSERPYKKPFAHEEAVKIIFNGRGSHFDPALVDVFMENEQKFKEISSLGLSEINMGA